MGKYAIGLDFGTNSCRALLVDLNDGRELASSAFAYPSGEAGVIIDPADPNLARQNPADYLLGIESTVRRVLAETHDTHPEFSPRDVIGIGVDTTGSSPMPVDADGMPVSFDERFKENPAAMVWLWKDHTGYAEAARITSTAAKMRPQYLARIGGTYSSEWFWSKILHCKETAPDVYNATTSVVEICDWIPAVLTGETSPGKIKRSVCAAGHKAMFSRDWNGLPDAEFLESLSPGLGKLRANLYEEASTSDVRAGTLSPAWASTLGLSENVAVAVGAFDAHMGAVGAGISSGTLVKIIGTSTCDIMIWPHDQKLQDIPGVCGVVADGVVPVIAGAQPSGSKPRAAAKKTASNQGDLF